MITDTSLECQNGMCWDCPIKGCQHECHRVESWHQPTDDELELETDSD